MKKTDIEIIASTTCITSLQIAEATGKKHQHIMRDIRDLLDQGCDESNFGLINYIDSRGRCKPCYNLTKKGALLLASGYSALLREKIINRLEELETERMTSRERLLSDQSFLSAVAERLEGSVEFGEAARLERELKREREITERLLRMSECLADAVMPKKRRTSGQVCGMEASEDVDDPKKPRGRRQDETAERIYPSLVVAKKLGIGGAAQFNQILQELGIQYCKGHKGEWAIYPPYDTLGIHAPLRNTEGQPDRRRTGWTEKGVQFFTVLFENEMDILKAVESVGGNPDDFIIYANATAIEEGDSEEQTNNNQ